MSASSAASALAQVLATHPCDEVLQGISLYYSLFPEISEPILELLSKPPAQRYHGQISKLFPDKRYGFIQCLEAAHEFDRDVFCSCDEIGTFGIGQEVSFSIVLNKNNHPQARLLLDTSSGTLADIGTSEPATKKRRLAQPQGNTFGGPWTAYPQKKTAEEHNFDDPFASLEHKQVSGSSRPSVRVSNNPYLEPVENETSPRLAGIIKQFNPEKQFGFIASQAAMDAFSRDVFLSSMEIKEFSVGDHVSFDVVLNKNRHPQARNLERRFVGSIKQFSAEKRFGFIFSPAASEVFGGRDVFLSSMEVKAFLVGDSVSFDVALNKHGHPQARNLEAANAPHMHAHRMRPSCGPVV